ncbi:MAG: hypothetical protein NTY20_02740 [Candidatus Aenigmarchaeota archaeon]|nr:hypothetical protein [Candidatus Aenigmarchaeota archaeon]
MPIETEPCDTCSLYSKGIKDSLKSLRDGDVAVDLADGLYSLLPAEEQSKILKISLELHDKPEEILKEFYGYIEKIETL